MSAATGSSLDLVLRDIEPRDITPHFQPIVDLFTAGVCGYEVLSRGPAPFDAPAMLFTRARHLRLVEDLERSCLLAALSRIAALASDRPRCDWFINVTPEVFCESIAAEIAEEVRAHGLEPRRIVFEITERESIADHARLQYAVRAHANEGFRIALDDFGSGSSGLLTLVACTPDVIKLDMALTRDLDADAYKQNVVQAIVALAKSVNARLIAEGVEGWAELEMLAAQGVRFAQGRLFAAPQPEPAELSGAVAMALMETMSRCWPRMVRRAMRPSPHPETAAF